MVVCGVKNWAPVTSSSVSISSNSINTSCTISLVFETEDSVFEDVVVAGAMFDGSRNVSPFVG